MVLRCELPENPENYHEFFEVLLNVAGTNPNCTLDTIKEWSRDIIDIDDRAHSEGRKAITTAKARKLLFKMRAMMSRGDNAHVGLSGLSTIVTERVHHHGEMVEHVKIPQESQNPGIFGFLKRK